MLALALVALTIWNPHAGVDYWLAGERDPVSDDESEERGRVEGSREAERDLANGTPWLRRSLGGANALDGELGIDRETGLPLQDTTLFCGTGVDFVAYRAAIKAYNERMLRAHAAGELRRFRLDGKLRGYEELRALAEARESTYIPAGETTIAAGGREYFVDANERGQEVRGFYMVDGARRLQPLISPKGPFHVCLVDDETTLIVRDDDDGFWIIDVPRLVVVQHVPAP
jgi:hypothetical protein